VTALSDRKGDYGFDAPNVLLTLTGIGLVFLAIAVVLAAFHVGFWAPAASISLFVLFGAASFTYTTRRGKFAVWAEILEGLQLRGDERVLDMGSGRGAIQLMAAQLVPRGQGSASTSGARPTSPATRRRSRSATLNLKVSPATPHSRPAT